MQIAVLLIDFGALDSRGPWTLRLQTTQVFVCSICEKDLASSTLAALHFSDHLASGHLGLVGFHCGSSFLHSLHLLFVACLFSFLLLPDAVCDLGHDLVFLFDFFVILLLLSLLVVHHFLEVELLLLLNDAVFEPVLKLLMTLFLLFDFLKTFDFLLSQFVPLFENSGKVFVFNPVLHGVESILVQLILLGLFFNKLLVEVFLGLVYELALKLFLVLFLTDPHFVIEIAFARLIGIGVCIDETAIEFAHCTLLIVVGVFNFFVIFAPVLSLLLNVSFCHFVKSFEQFLVSKVLFLLLIHVELVSIMFVLVFRVLIGALVSC